MAEIHVGMKLYYKHQYTLEHERVDVSPGCIVLDSASQNRTLLVIENNK